MNNQIQTHVRRLLQLSRPQLSVISPVGKIIDGPMSAADLNRYVVERSDFAFEMEIYKVLHDLPYKCEHGGTYIDHVTQKAREFDIRAWTRDRYSWTYLAVECKNLKDNSPLVVSCIPRRGFESYHDVMVTFPPEQWPQEDVVAVINETTAVKIRLHKRAYPYPVGGLVGKSCAQVGKDKENELQITGTEIYEKWSQALASARGLAEKAATRYPDQPTVRYSVVIPMVVVPDGTLWAAEYSDTGALLKPPAITDRVSYYINHDISFEADFNWETYEISHIEFVTKKGLGEFAKNLAAEAGREWYLPDDFIDDEFEKLRRQAEAE